MKLFGELLPLTAMPTDTSSSSSSSSEHHQPSSLVCLERPYDEEGEEEGEEANGGPLPPEHRVLSSYRGKTEQQAQANRHPHTHKHKSSI